LATLFFIRVGVLATDQQNLFEFFRVNDRATTAKSDRSHFKVFFAGAAFRASPVHRDLIPAGARCDAFFGQASGLVIDPAANEAHPCFEFLIVCLVVAHGTALQVKCKVSYLNLVPVQNQTSPLVLTFGVTDPVGAIGIQADLASFAAMGCHGLSVVTALAIGDTTRTDDIQAIDPDWVADQARVLLEDMPVSAFKVGYVGNIENISVIAEIVSDYPEVPLVLDPFSTVLPDQNLDEDLLLAMRELLVPQTTVLLLSVDELSRLAETWREPSTELMLEADAMHLIESGCEFLFVTGTPGDAHDVSNTLFNEAGVVRHDSWQRQAGPFVGAGNTLSATIAAMLANGLDVPEAVFEAEEFTVAALAHAQRLGMGKLIPDRYFWARESDGPSELS
jgi:hydroxymethylpyrimidine/phosphomethylpyrimidine kinase